MYQSVGCCASNIHAFANTQIETVTYEWTQVLFWRSELNSHWTSTVGQQRYAVEIVAVISAVLL